MWWCVHINKRLWVRAQLGKGKASRVNQRRATNKQVRAGPNASRFFRGFRHIQPGLTMAGRSKSIFFHFDWAPNERSLFFSAITAPRSIPSFHLWAH